MKNNVTSLLQVASFTIFFVLIIIIPICMSAFAQTTSSFLPKPSLSSACTQSQLLSETGSNISSIGVIGQGRISSVLNLPHGLKYVAAGYWNIADNGRSGNFLVNMTWYPNTPTNTTAAKQHTHGIHLVKFLPGQQQLAVQPNNISIAGCADVSTNGKVDWPVIPILIKIEGKTIDISLTGTDQYSVSAKNHFAAQHVMGVVDSLKACSDLPQPNMQILDPCELSTSATQGNRIGNLEASNGGLLPFIPIQ